MSRPTSPSTSAPVDLPTEDRPAETDRAPARTVDGEALRRAMRLVASPVVVVTAAAGEHVRGATIGSFTSVSLSPPLVAFNVTRETKLHDVLRQADCFAVHLLAAEHAALAADFARPDLDNATLFAPHPHRPATGGVPPLLDGTLGILVCRPESRFAAGDHSIFVGRVEEVIPGRDGEPLVYHGQTYRTVGEEVGREA